MGRGIGHGQERRFQAREIGVLAVEAVDRVVRARLRDDLGDDMAVVSGNDVPVVRFERRNVEVRPVGRDRHPVTASHVGTLPEDLLGFEVEARQRLGGDDVDPAGSSTRTNALDVVGLALVVETGRS